MKKLTLLLIFTGIITLSSGQVRVSKLVIKPHEVYSLGQSDILVADTLIMMDHSKIKLNNLRSENYIRAQVAIIGDSTMIDGHGLNGAPGRDGRNGDTPFGPCRDGEEARNGGKGLRGGPGINLFLYFEELTVSGKLIVDISGGHGGDGGDGGNGGGGSPGTVHCKGGDGGNGGNGGDGGNGGNGGLLTISCVRCPDIRALVSKNFLLRLGGGEFGFAGVGGYGGPPGLAPNRRNGVKGEQGIDGNNGRSGEKGALNFEIN